MKFVCQMGKGYRVTVRSDVLDPSTGMEIVTRYLHLFESPVSYWGINSGSRVLQGTRIGSVGTTGLSTGYHLHLDVNGRNITGLLPYSLALNPERFFPHITFTGQSNRN